MPGLVERSAWRAKSCAAKSAVAFSTALRERSQLPPPNFESLGAALPMPT